VLSRSKQGWGEGSPVTLVSPGLPFDRHKACLRRSKGRTGGEGNARRANGYQTSGQQGHVQGGLEGGAEGEQDGLGERGRDQLDADREMLLGSEAAGE
jgi:hypothetical protein